MEYIVIYFFNQYTSLAGGELGTSWAWLIRQDEIHFVDCVESKLIKAYLFIYISFQSPRRHLCRCGCKNKHRGEQKKCKHNCLFWTPFEASSSSAPALLETPPSALWPNLAAQEGEGGIHRRLRTHLTKDKITRGNNSNRKSNKLRFAKQHFGLDKIEKLAVF